MDKILQSYLNLFSQDSEDFKYDLDPLIIATYICSISSVFCWIGQITTKNLSFVDRLWPILPMIYTWLFTLYPVLKGQGLNLRLVVSTLGVTMWGLRLTYNYYRKGGYEMQAEDYRWVFVRKMIPAFLFQVFNFAFIAVFQNFLLLGFTLPAYVMYLFRHIQFNFYDSIFMGAFYSFFIIECVADQQQWIFQNQKYKLIEENKIDEKPEYKKGFLTWGLFRYSRHPNFFAEIMLWWSFYFLSISSSGKFINFSIFGSFFLTLLFQGSTRLTENISRSKYPLYEKYQKEVSRLIPWFSNVSKSLA